MEYNQAELRSELLILSELSDEELLERLIPEEERHSPHANLERAKDILCQCVSRVKGNLKDVYCKHKHVANFSIDFALYLIPVLTSNPTIPTHLIPVLAILIMRHGAEFLFEQ